MNKTIRRILEENEINSNEKSYEQSWFTCLEFYGAERNAYLTLYDIDCGKELDLWNDFENIKTRRALMVLFFAEIYKEEFFKG